MSDKTPLVSVVMPVFNAAPYLDEAIESILQQTFSKFELIIINDGSTDSSFEMLQKWEKADQRIRLFDQQNQGRSMTRNRGLLVATTDFVAMMDADDISVSNRLEVCYDYLKNNPNVVAVSGKCECMCMHGIPVHVSSVPLGHNEIEQSLLQDNGNDFAQGASMMHKKIALAVGGYNREYEMGEDADLFLRMALKGELVNLPKILLRYRQHPRSITNLADKKLIANCIKRLEGSWADRGLTLDNDFEHWLENNPEKKEYQSLLSWGWNALGKGRVDISRRYAKKLILFEPFNREVWRFIFCVIRGR